MGSERRKMKGHSPNSKNKQDGEFERIFSYFPLRCLERLAKFSYPDHQTKNRVTLLLRKKYSLTVPRLPCEQGLYSVMCTVMAPEKVTSTRCACKVAEWTLGCLLFPLSLPDCLKTPHYAYIQKFHKRQENYNIFKPTTGEKV